MTAFALEALHLIGQMLAGLLMLVMLGFIAGVCVCCVMRTRPNGYAQRFRLPKDRRPKRRTLFITPDHQDPHIVGDVPHFHQAQYPASRPNVRRGEG